MIYGQTEVTQDLYEAQDAIGATVIHKAEDVALHDLTARALCDLDRRGRAGTGSTAISSRAATGSMASAALRCRPLCGANSRRSIPSAGLAFCRDTPPADSELIYAAHDRGFALASMRNATLSRYLHPGAADRPGRGLVGRGLLGRVQGPDAAGCGRARLVTGPSIEKSIAPLRSLVVTEPMRWGRLFLCGDAAHIVPPTGAKGLNLAASDVHYLFEGLTRALPGRRSRHRRLFRSGRWRGSGRRCASPGR